MKKRQNLIDEQVRQAMQDGEFDNLAGQGKPLDLSENPHEDPAWQMAFKALRSSGYSLPWIEKRRQIETEYEVAIQTLAVAWEWYTHTSAGGTPHRDAVEEWQRARGVFRAKIADLNRRIASYNLEVPSMQFQRCKIQPEIEIEQIISSVD